MASQAKPAPVTYRDLFVGGRAELSLAIVLLLAVATLDVLIVATAMPTILSQLGDVELYSWTFSAYTLTSIMSLPVFGALTGRLSLLRVMTLAIAIFLAGSIIAALASSMLMLVIGRGVQGIGAGGLFAIPAIIISARYPSALQPLAIALTSGVWGVSSLTGPLVGALLLHIWGWQAIFWVNIPICAVVLLLGYLGLRTTTHSSRPTQPVNLLSPLLLTVATGLLLAATTARGGSALLLAGCGIGAALGYAWAERRSAEPIVPYEAWRARGPLGAALAVVTLASVGFFAAETFLPLLMQSGRGRSAIEAGVIISLGSIAWTVGSIATSRHATPGPRAKTALGLVLIGVGVALLWLLVALSWPTFIAYIGWCLAGLGIGVLHPACTTVIIDAAGPDGASITASGQLAMSLGTSAGTALAGAMAAIGFGPSFTPERNGGALSGELLVLLDRGVAYALLFALVVTLLPLLFTWRLPTKRTVELHE